MPYILDLPTEVLIRILLDLDVFDFGSCILTCRRLKAIIQGSCLLRYLIHTALAGVHDPTHSSSLASSAMVVGESKQRRMFALALHFGGLYGAFPSYGGLYTWRSFLLVRRQRGIHR